MMLAFSTPDACLLWRSWHEQTHRNLMLMFLMKGEHTAALKQYEQCRQILAHEFGVVPCSETQALYENIRQQILFSNPSDKAAVLDTAAHTGALQHSIRAECTPFIGRVKELRAIDNVLGDRSARLITIFGVGGIGKTRVALTIAEQQMRRLERDGNLRFVDGVYFVPLETAESKNEIMPAICQSLGFRPIKQSVAGQSVEDQLLVFLRKKRLLLILDNFEHLMDGIGELQKILRSATSVHLLVTSRQKLGLHGERLYALEGLTYPRAFEPTMYREAILEQYSAMSLFASCLPRTA